MTTLIADTMTTLIIIGAIATLTFTMAQFLRRPADPTKPRFHPDNLRAIARTLNGQDRHAPTTTQTRAHTNARATAHSPRRHSAHPSVRAAATR